MIQKYYIMLFVLEEGEYQKKVKGGAIQLVLERMTFDSYPYHRAGTTSFQLNIVK